MDQTVSQPPLVVIGQSARMLAVSAARARLYPIAIDVFGDKDTREVALTMALPSLEEDPVLGALQGIVTECGRPRLVYGSGIDTRPDLVERISGLADVSGNSPSVLRVMHSPESFFRLLDSLAIPYPEIRFNRPEDPDAWLFKIPFTEGGRGILSGSSHPEHVQGYYQKKLEGTAMSVLFLANREEAFIIGFNTQWTAGPEAPLPHLFGGIMNTAELAIQQKIQICGYITKLVKSASLAGLNSLDFMFDRGKCMVLELNPRPSASLILYDKYFPHGLLAEHIRAVTGLPVRKPNPGIPGVSGLEIVYARQPCVIGRSIHWPGWTLDRPMPGTKIAAGDAICTVTAKATGRKALGILLALRKRKIRNLIFWRTKRNL
ncbi:MAG: ATP-grasp domain-containing protein [Methylococcaceae bacterium]|nr:ATP-grasp domain-containing protein [Methylococcaceae bacterium]